LQPADHVEFGIHFPVLQTEQVTRTRRRNLLANLHGHAPATGQMAIFLMDSSDFTIFSLERFKRKSAGNDLFSHETYETSEQKIL